MAHITWKLSILVCFVLFCSCAIWFLALAWPFFSLQQLKKQNPYVEPNGECHIRCSRMEKKRQFANFIGVCIKADVKAVVFAIYLSLIIIVMLCVCMWMSASEQNVRYLTSILGQQPRTIIANQFHILYVFPNQFYIIHYSIALKTRIGMWRTVDRFPFCWLKKHFFPLLLLLPRTFIASPKNRTRATMFHTIYGMNCTRVHETMIDVKLFNYYCQITHIARQREKKIHQITKWLKSHRNTNALKNGIKLKIEHGKKSRSYFVKRQLFAVFSTQSNICSLPTI